MSPNPGGRPPVGQPINVRLGADLLAEVDTLATEAGQSRAQIIRRLVAAGIPRAHSDRCAFTASRAVPPDQDSAGTIGA